MSFATLYQGVSVTFSGTLRGFRKENLTIAAVFLAVPFATWGQNWGEIANISATMGVNDGRICTGEFSRGDIGCATSAPYVSRTNGFVGIGTANPTTQLTVSGTVSATRFVGDGSLLTGLSATGDRITSGTTSVTAQSGGVVSITTSGVTTNYFNASGLLITPGISVTTANGISSTNGYFSGKIGMGTTQPVAPLHVSGTFTGFASAPSGSVGLGNLIYAPTTWKGPSIVFRPLVGTAQFGMMAYNSDAFYFGRMIGTDANAAHKMLTVAPTTMTYSEDVSDTDTTRREIEIQSKGYAGLRLRGDTDNVVGEPGGAYAQFALDAEGSGAPYIGKTNRNGESPLGVSVTDALGNALILGTSYNTFGDIQFATSNTVAMTINENGYIGIGTTNPAAKLEVNGTSIATALEAGNIHGEPTGTDDVGAPSTNFYEGVMQAIETNSTSGLKAAMLFDSNEIQTVSQTTASAVVASSFGINYFGGNVTIGNASYGSNLLVYGTVSSCTLGNGTGTTACTSDRRLKQDIHPLQGSLEKITALHGVHFKWKKDPSETRIGLIAQDVEKQFPEVVETDPDTGMKAVAYASLVAPLIEAVKELKVENQQLHGNIEELKADNDNLRSRLERLESRAR